MPAFETVVHVTPQATFTLKVEANCASGHVDALVPFGNWKEDVQSQAMDPSTDEVRIAASKALDADLNLELLFNGYEHAGPHEPLTIHFRAAKPEALERFCEKAEDRQEAKAATDDGEVTVIGSATASGEPVDDHFLQKIGEAEKCCRVAESEVEKAKAEYHEAKKHYDATVQRLRQLCARVNESMPLFDQAQNRPWEKVPLAEALQGIGEAIIGKLGEAELHTLGELTDYLNAQSKNGHSNPLTTIKGLGPMKAEQVSKALEGFWEKQKA